MPTQSVDLTDHEESVIDRLVASGRYRNASEVFREGVRLIEEREAENARKTAALREAVQAGFDAIERGDYKEFDSAEELSAYLEEITEAIIAESAEDK